MRNCENTAHDTAHDLSRYLMFTLGLHNLLIENQHLILFHPFVWRTFDLPIRQSIFSQGRIQRCPAKSVNCMTTKSRRQVWGAKGKVFTFEKIADVSVKLTNSVDKRSA